MCFGPVLSAVINGRFISVWVDEESSILDTLSKNSKRYVIKSKNFKDDQVELIAEARLPKDNNLSKEFSKQSGIIDFSLLAYSSNILDN